MIVDGGVRFGHEPHLTVRRWLEENRSAIGRLPYLLISSIDSERDVWAMPWAAEYRRDDSSWALSERPLVVSGRSVVELLANGQRFTGFDELWVPARLPVAHPPSNAYLVAPRRLDVESPPEIREWLDASDCRLGVGDGDGMNYVVGDFTLGAELSLG